MSRSPGCVPGPSRLRILALVLVAPPAWPASAVGQAISLPTVHAAPRAGSIEIGGRLHERAWTTVHPFDAFIQGEPVEGVPAEAPTSVRMLYDRDAIYIGARMDDPAPGSIARQLTRRGEVGDAADHFEVSFDSNNDRRTAYTFRVTAAGVQSDRYRYDDTSEDGKWEAVWAAAVHHDEGGWIVEMRIPLSQLRFDPSDESQSRGINFVLRDGLGIREIEGRGLIAVEFRLGRAPSGGHPGRPMWEVEMEEDALYGGGQGDEREDPHLSTACGARKREHLVDASHGVGRVIG